MSLEKKLQPPFQKEVIANFKLTQNGDAIKAWMDNGIIHVVGDSSRPILNNPVRSLHPVLLSYADII
jgi:hypothetical protein